jgi:hypothetical protein
VSTTKRQSATPPTVDIYAIMERLHTDTLRVQTIPGEQWALSCARHPELLVDVYTLTGKATGARKTHTYRSGLLTQVLLSMLWIDLSWTERHVQFHSHRDDEDEGNVIHYAGRNARLGTTLEEETIIRLRDGDLIFHAIPGESWRLTHTSFGRMSAGVLFYLAEESTLGTPQARYYSHTRLYYLLLAFLCQKHSWEEKQQTNAILPFRNTK